MDVHEYQAKELLATFGVPVPKGAVAFSPDQAVYAATELGGWNWAVNKYSKNTKAAVDLAKYLTSPEEQKRAAIEVSFNPTIPALYKDKDILAKNPFIGDLLSTFTNAVARPSRVTGSKYNQVSSEFWNAVHEVLSGKSQAEESVAKLEKTLTRLSRNGKW